MLVSIIEYAIIILLSFEVSGFVDQGCTKDKVQGQMQYSVKNTLVEPLFHYTIDMNITGCNTTRLITYMEHACDNYKDTFKNFSQTYFPGVGYYVSAFNGVTEIFGERYWELIEHSMGKQYQVGSNLYIPQPGDHVAWNLTELDLSKYPTTPTNSQMTTKQSLQ